MNCGLLGEKLGHSYSPAIHAMLADYDYRLYEKGAGRSAARIRTLTVFRTCCKASASIPRAKSA